VFLVEQKRHTLDRVPLPLFHYYHLQKIQYHMGYLKSIKKIVKFIVCQMAEFIKIKFGSQDLMSKNGIIKKRRIICKK